MEEDKKSKDLMDMYIMGEQNLIYEIIKEFLKSDEAIEFNLSGINVYIEDGFVNAEWKFSDRRKGDIKHEIK